MECLPGCFCERCMPLRMNDLQRMNSDEQTAFWSRLLSMPGPQSRQAPRPANQPPPPPPPPQQPQGGQPLPGVSESTRLRAANFDMPYNVERFVPNLRDAFEIIQGNLECVAGPRRRQCMMEAMQEVINAYSHMFVDAQPPSAPAKFELETVEGVQLDTFQDAANTDADTTMCTVCHDTFNNGDTRMILSCSHIFHKVCIEGWITSRFKETRSSDNIPCVNCRTPIKARFRQVD